MIKHMLPSSQECCLLLTNCSKSNPSPEIALGKFIGNSVVKNLPANAADMGSIPGSGRSPLVGNGNSFQHSCLEKFHGQRSLTCCSPCGLKQSDVTEPLSRDTEGTESPRIKAPPQGKPASSDRSTWEVGTKAQSS